MLQAALSPSLMCADLFNMGEILRTFTAAGIEYLHIDVMDGDFVPNYCLGTSFCRQVRAACPIPQDLHLMVAQPERKLSYFDVRPGDLVSVHYESTTQVEKALQQIREAGASAFLALNPDTRVETALDYLPLLDGVLLMTVSPGFAGQPMAPGSLARIAALRALLNETGGEKIRIEVDGSVSYEKAPLMRAAGADLFVSGTSGVFRPGDLSENIAALRALLR